MTTEVIEDQAETVTQDDVAPWGRRSDGTPRGKPGPKRGPSAGPGGPAAPPRRPGGPRPPKSTPKRSAPDYREGIQGLLQIGAFPLALAGKRSESFALDAAAVTIHGPQIAAALNAVAQERPEVAAALDRILSVGPYGLLIGAMIPLAAQIMTNHGKLPGEVAAGMGAIPRETLIVQLQSESSGRHAS